MWLWKRGKKKFTRGETWGVVSSLRRWVTLRFLFVYSLSRRSEEQKLKTIYMISELAFVLAVVSLVVILRSTIKLWLKPKTLDNVQEIVKAPHVKHFKGVLSLLTPVTLLPTAFIMINPLLLASFVYWLVALTPFIIPLLILTKPINFSI